MPFEFFGGLRSSDIIFNWGNIKMDNKVQISDPELVSFSVTVKLYTDFICHSGYKMLSEWLKHFSTLNNLYAEHKEYYSKCVSILKHASFCEGLFAKIDHDKDEHKEFVNLTLYFSDINSLTKFIEGFEEKINSPASAFSFF